MSMERLTSKRDWIEAGKDLSHEYGYSHIWRRLKQVEDIIGDTYDLERLQELVEACKAGGAGLLARILYDFGNRNGDEGGQAFHRRSGLRQILTGKGLFNMFTKKKTCGVCGYRVTPTKEEIYVAEEPRGFMDALTKPPTRFSAMDCPRCGCQIALAVHFPRVDRSAWEPCEHCKPHQYQPGYCDPNTFPVAGNTIQYYDIVEGTVIEEIDFCPWCGRPLTDAAWDMLERRLAEREHQ